MRTVRLLPPALLVALLVPAPSLAADAAVKVSDDFFDPGSGVQIQPGDTVTWNWIGSNEHNVVSKPGQVDRWRSGAPTSRRGTIFARTFNRPGRFRYFCEVHFTNMKGTIVVGTPETVPP